MEYRIDTKMTAGRLNERDKPAANNPGRSVQKVRMCCKQSPANTEEVKRQHSYPIRQKMLSNFGKVREERPPTFVELEKTKSLDLKNVPNDVKIEDIFWNSDYFKLQSGNVSSLSFCSGDNAENRWKIDSAPEKLMPPKMSLASNNAAKSETAVGAGKGTEKSPSPIRAKKPPPPFSDVIPVNTGKLNDVVSARSRAEGDLINVVSQQMFLAERELQTTRSHLIETIKKLSERDVEIIRLQEKIQALQKTKGSVKIRQQLKNESGGKPDEYQKLFTQSEELKKQLADMEDFLSDYGLVWVGNSNQWKPDIDKIVKNFKNLNAIATEPKIIQTTLGAKFELPKEFPVTLYANGLLLRNKEFREYRKKSTVQFLKDVEDGYFPSELQGDYPEGVPFEVTDKREEVYSQSDQRPVFQGTGHRLGSSLESKSSGMVYLEPLRQTRVIDAQSIQPSLLHENSRCKKTQRRSKSVREQEHHYGRMASMLLAQAERGDVDDFQFKPDGNLITVKIRVGAKSSECITMVMMSNEKMSVFQKGLEKKLCERYHDECIIRHNSGFSPVDFELHIYGHPPFRLSEHLNDYLSDCDITDNCVINVTEL